MSTTMSSISSASASAQTTPSSSTATSRRASSELHVVPSLSKEVSPPSPLSSPCAVDEKATLSYVLHSPSLQHPSTWSPLQRALQTSLICLSGMPASFGSSLFSGGASLHSLSSSFHTSPQVGILGTSLFILGLAIGPVMGSALSETQGRKKLLVLPPMASVFFGIMATSTLYFPLFLASRFLQGLLGATPVSVGGAALVDIWGGMYATTWPLAGMIFSSFSGALVSPTLVSLLLPLGDWRSASWAGVVFGASIALLLACALRETHEATLLARQAQALRLESRNWYWHAPAELEHVNIQRLVQVYLARPLLMLVREPMLALLSTYVAFVFSLLYLLFGAYPRVFTPLGFSGLGCSLALLPVLLGLALGALLHLLLVPRLHRRRAIRGNVPEDRLLPLGLGALLFAAGLLLFSLSIPSSPSSSMHTAVPLLASGLLTGAGFLLIMLSALCWSVDVYAQHSASALAANAALRGVLGAVMPLLGRPMFEALGTRTSMLLLTAIAGALCVLPPIFFVFGARLRQRSSFAVQP